MRERFAETALAGVGAAKFGEWRQDRPQAFHIRRRLTRAEEAKVGPVLDLRGTDEARARLTAAMPSLHQQVLEFAMDEISVVGEQG